MSERVSPFHCPYCAEENLWPHEPEGWECRSCLRAFSVKFLGQLRVSTSSTSGDAPAGHTNREEARS